MGLVVGRKPGEGFVVISPTGEEIKIHVVKREDGLLRINIDAPKEYQILRSELIGGTDAAKNTKTNTRR
ncbi:carbon storage regulator [Bacillus badius]|uniref:carbon storage regulator n=1 Tax=Bacillus badius TaxID=1455 RepID=UPI000597238F|nr:carbon storage regulator [Bacillus badius]KIL71937.1 hypothetical protein SD78_1242 [Bacillus badius]MED0665719.1 carbon storage regulator [Bacillus badius]UAT29948.1 carbon storage regulator [Bacillus badius]